ncbi:hypothetical protein QJQ45_002989 [Haematococcus lacustris]|nr:hypothetical protein QJQ45_002989 [Haematococcus lacustris]
MASESTPASGAAAGLSQYMTRLTQDEQADALSKFVAAGYTDAMHDLVTRLSNQELAEIGIQPQAVRSALRKAFALTGPGKTIVIMDSTGAEEVLQFDSWKVFEIWSRSNILKQLQQDGTKEVIVMWEQVQDGGLYYTDKTLDNKVGDMEGFQSTRFKSLEDEVAERALADMRQQYPDASRLCMDELKDKSGRTRQYDGIIVAEDCVKVVEVKSQVDMDAAFQLCTSIEFMRQAAEDGAADFQFARRADGSMKEVKGALGGLHVAAGNLHKKALMRTINEVFARMSARITAAAKRQPASYPASRALDVLLGLSALPRLEMAAMCVGRREREQLSALWGRVFGCGAQESAVRLGCDHDQVEKVTAVRHKFKL